ncbi:MAG TPA: homoserine dehydrogenase [Planctomycetota bacterium]|nr:homoserine dehydrogenase [Planctomycetota bacterium]
MKKVSIGLLGCGTVGKGLVELIRRNRDVVAHRTGIEVEVARVLVRDPRKERPVAPEKLTTDPAAVIEAKDVHIVVELMGGVEPAKAYVLRALAARKHVVTANKAMLSAAGGAIFRRAVDARCRIGFEASVCGGIPIIRALSAGLVGNRITTLVGIVNGTCNFILTKMAEERCLFAKALVEAQRLGFAEADPSLDLDGRDAAQKLQLLSELAFDVILDQVQFPVEGIRHIEDEDLRTAKELGYVIKHLAIGKDLGETLDLRVHPALLPNIHPLAHVRDEFNSVLLRGDAVDEMIFTGKGAGSLPTASAVLSDILEIARSGDPEHGEPWHLPTGKQKPITPDITCKYYLRFPIKDVPGVIGHITTALGNRGISITHAAASLAEGKPGYGNVKILAHDCRESALRAALEEVAKLPVLAGKPVILRIFEEG